MVAMLCAKCHAEVPADAAFCPKCGTAVADAAVGGARLATPTERMQGAQAAAPQEPEHELWHGGYSAKAMYGGWVLATLLTVAAIILAALTYNPAIGIAAAMAVPAVWVFLLLTLLYRRLCVSYTLTSQRFMHQKG